jgi:thiamine pyrophosphokinase
VVGAVGGRLDHQLSNIHILYKFKELRIVLLGRGNLALLLPEPFEHVLFPDRVTEGPICALIPVGTPVKNVYTSGLRWNLGEGNFTYFFVILVCSTEVLHIAQTCPYVMLPR